MFLRATKTICRSPRGTEALCCVLRHRDISRNSLELAGAIVLGIALNAGAAARDRASSENLTYRTRASIKAAIFLGNETRCGAVCSIVTFDKVT